MAGLMALSTVVSAQKPFAGNVKRKLYVEGTTDPNITSQFPIEQQVTVMGNKVKTELSAQGIGQTMIVDGDNQVVTTILDVSMMGMGIYYSVDTAKAPENFSYSTKEDRNDTKNIAGYNAHKVTWTQTNLEDDETMDVVFYVSDDFLPDFKDPQFPNLKGYQLMTIVTQGEGEDQYQVIDEVYEITPNKKVKSASFLLPEKAVPAAEGPAMIKQIFGVE